MVGSPWGDALGGDVKAVAGAALAFPLPSERLQDFGLRLQLFGNVGTLYQLHGVGPLDVHRKPAVRASAGVGLVCPTPFGRLELNICKVLSQQGEGPNAGADVLSARYVLKGRRCGTDRRGKERGEEVGLVLKSASCLPSFDRG